MDWKDSLKQFLDSNPSLPQGEDKPTPEEPEQPLPPLDIFIDRKGRKGKSATIIAGFDPDDEETLKEVAAKLKSALATGGSARGGEILIQGERRADVERVLRSLGYKRLRQC